LDVVIVARFDRFARSTRHLILALEEFQSLGVDFISLNESIDTSTALLRWRHRGDRQLGCNRHRG
jgi:DNA invertase Pin-like site-specific DNA recombinase